MSTKLHLFHFQDAPFDYGTPTQHWRHADASATGGIAYNAEWYAPTAISAGSPSHGHSEKAGELDIEVSIDHPLVGLHEASPPDKTIHVRIHEIDFVGPNDLTGEVWWTGAIAVVHRKGSLGILQCQTIDAVNDRTIPTGRYRRECRWTLFGPGCGLNQGAFDQAMTVTAISTDGRTIKMEGATAIDANWATFGAVVAADYSQSVMSNTASVDPDADGVWETDVTVVAPIPGLAVGDAVTLIPGCDKQTDTCDAKFSNLANFGGLPAIPDRNPWRGGR